MGAFERGRAEVQVGIPQAAHSLEQMVLIKRFHAHAPEADWLQLVAELELASWLRHDNIVRTLGIGLEAGRYFMIKEFLEGATLRACLAWSAASHARLGNVVVAHILLAILDAVKHASAVAARVRARRSCARRLPPTMCSSPTTARSSCSLQERTRAQRGGWRSPRAPAPSMPCSSSS
jgi:hypothetical protein